MFKTRRRGQFLRIALVLIVVGVFGAYYINLIRAYSGNHAKCVIFNANNGNYTVVGGSTFKGTVEMKNDGTTTWSAGGGYLLRDPNSRWHFTGNTLAHSVAPNAYYTFSLGLTAPAASTTSTTYGYNAEMFKSGTGTIPIVCPTKYITVAARPTVAITSPSAGHTVSGSNVIISASASQPTKNVSITKVVFYVNGSTIYTDTSSTYNASWNTTRGYRNGSYSLTARVYDSLGQSRLSSSVGVTVHNTTSSGGSGSHGGSTNTGSNTSGTFIPPPDRTAPSTPKNLTVFLNQETKIVSLTWLASTDNRGVKGYNIQRSTDQKSWKTLVSVLNHDNYEDDTVGFDQKYFYRVQAVDTSGNKSGWANVSVNMPSFDANVKANSDTTISTDDQAVDILIPAGALSVDALCSVRLTADLNAPALDRYDVVGGPYDVSCRDKDGNAITTFNKALTATIKLDTVAPNDHRQFEYYGQKNDNWDKLSVTSHDAGARTDTLQLKDYTVFIIMAKHPTPPIWKAIVKILLVIGVTAAVGLLGVRFLVQRKAKKSYQDYVKKAHGW